MSLAYLREMFPEVPVERCRGCGRQIVWGRKADGVMVPLNPSPPVYKLIQTASGAVVCEKVDGVFVNHFVDCKDANKF